MIGKPLHILTSTVRTIPVDRLAQPDVQRRRGAEAEQALGADQAAAAGALGNLTKTLGVEWARDGIRVNSVLTRDAGATKAALQALTAAARTKPGDANLMEKILDAALEVFSAYGFRGATVDQIAALAGMTKPNLLYYFRRKEDIHVTLIQRLLDNWLAPLRELDDIGDPMSEIRSYIRRKLEMARDFPRESRLFANEIKSKSRSA